MSTPDELQQRNRKVRNWLGCDDDETPARCRHMPPSLVVCGDDGSSWDSWCSVEKMGTWRTIHPWTMDPRIHNGWWAQLIREEDKEHGAAGTVAWDGNARALLLHHAHPPSIHPYLFQFSLECRKELAMAAWALSCCWEPEVGTDSVPPLACIYRGNVFQYFPWVLLSLIQTQE